VALVTAGRSTVWGWRGRRECRGAAGGREFPTVADRRYIWGAAGYQALPVGGGGWRSAGVRLVAASFRQPA
jgi:hypothetical protein